MSEKVNVLIADDEQGFAESLSDILSEKGYFTTVVHSGEEALNKIKEQSFDIVLMDIKMPVMNGVETFKKIKEIRPDSVVILMTAYSEDEVIREALHEKPYCLINKPLDVDKVIQTIEASRRQGVLIMIVDDDPNMSESLKDILEDNRYKVALAKTGEEAIAVVLEKSMDVVFVDMKLPVLNGLETYLALKKINPKITAIMMTAYRQEMKDLISQALHKSAYTCLYKPFNPEKVVELVKEIEAKRKNS